MDAGLLALFVQMIDSGTTLAFEAVRRKRSKDNLRLYNAFRSLDANSIGEKIGPIGLANFMSGGVSAASVHRLFARSDFKALTRELFLVCITEDKDSKPVTTVCSSLVLLSETVLSADASIEGAHAFGEALSNRLVELSQSAIQELDLVDPSLSAQLQQTALLKRMTSMLELVTAHHSALVRFANPQSAQARAKFIDDYRRACAERHGYITPPDFETNRKIPMEQLYVAPSIQSLGASRRERPLSLDDFMSSIDRTVVLGDPGGGKSTLSGFIASKLARIDDGPIPLHVTLRHFAPHSEDLSLLEFIEREMNPRYQLATVDGLIEDLLVTGNAIVIFDGLDELIDASKRREVTRSVELFGMQYPHAPILVTSRRVGYDQARLDPAVFDAFLIDGFEHNEVEKYVHNWFQSQDEFSEQDAREQAHAFVVQSAAVPDLRSNPLMLALMCIIFRGENYIPRNRPAVYEKCAMLLFEKWDGHRGIEVPLQARDHVDSAMKYIAYKFMSSNSGETGIPRKQMIDMLAEYLHPRAVESPERARRAAEEFVDYCSGRAWVFTDAGATADGEPIFTFTHRTFMEYFAAVHLTRITDTPEALAALLLPHVAREEWDVVAQLAVQQVDGSTDQGTSRALTAMLNEKRRRSITNRGHVLTFIARCLTFAVIPPVLVRQIATACAEYALERYSRTAPIPRNPDPLGELRDFTSGLEAEYAAEQVEAELIAAFGRDSQRLGALQIAFSWLVEDLMGELFGEPTETAWASVTVSIARAHSELLAASTDSKTLLPLLFGWHGILSVEEAQAEIDQSEPDFCTRYFEAPRLTGGNGLGPTLGEWIIYASEANRSNLSDDKVALIESISTGLKRDFQEMERMLPATIEQRKKLGVQRLFFFVPVSVEMSKVLADALIVVSLALAELHMVFEKGHAETRIRELFTHHWKESKKNEDLGMPDRAATPEIAQFAAQWLQQEVSVFENLNSILKSADKGKKNR